MKYIIEVEDIGGGLWKAKGFNTLVFDKNGLAKLKPVWEHGQRSMTVEDKIRVGDEVRCFNARFVVTWINGDWFYGITSLGTPLKRRKTSVRKTGRHFDLTEMIDGVSDDE